MWELTGARGAERERRALRLIGAAFFGLAIYITDGGVIHLTTHLGGDPNATPGSIDLPAVEAGGTMYASLGGGYNYVISADAAARLGLVVDKTSESNPQIVLRPPAISAGTISRAPVRLRPGSPAPR